MWRVPDCRHLPSFASDCLRWPSIAGPSRATCATARKRATRRHSPRPPPRPHRRAPPPSSTPLSPPRIHPPRVLFSAGYHPEIPEFGFGEPTSTRLIQDVIQCTSSCGAVRHGAECFNYWFPQELDKDFLVIWDGFQDPPWQSFKEEPLRKFLIERAKEGYSFPLNPCWPVRDPGWYEVMQALKGSRESVDNQNMWFPPDSGIAEKIERLHSAYPSGFKPAPPAAPGPRLRDGDAKKPPPPPLPPAHAVEKDLKKEASPKSGWFGDRV